MDHKTCWTMTTGEAGMNSQVLGLAEAVGIAHVHKTARPRPPWSWLPGHMCPGALISPDSNSDPLVPPWPALLITCGRRSVCLSIAIRKASRGRTFTVHVQDPHVPPSYFDMVAPPRHDRLKGANVFPTRGALHRVTPEILAANKERFGPGFAGLPRPLVAVLIGGDNKCYHLTPGKTAAIAARLAEMAKNTGAGLAITPSRRTGDANLAILREKLEGTGAYIWDGTGANPYFGMLGLADHIVVTCDSVSMVSEAAATGKPVYVIELDGGNRRFNSFHEGLRSEGVTRPFTGVLDQWTYKPVNDTTEIAGEVQRRLGERVTDKQEQ
ncbi:MAG: mitochondrial fission ELM1 family protein [Rhodospirillales bacterium]